MRKCTKLMHRSRKVFYLMILVLWNLPVCSWVTEKATCHFETSGTVCSETHYISEHWNPLLHCCEKHQNTKSILFVLMGYTVISHSVWREEVMLCNSHMDWQKLSGFVALPFIAHNTFHYRNRWSCGTKETRNIQTAVICKTSGSSSFLIPVAFYSHLQPLTSTTSIRG